ncbi:MAG: hypothetical protein QM764_09075 [Chitinophagaceae bacterium]
MKKFITAIVFLTQASALMAQLGVGTTSPTSTIDVRGSVATAYKSFTANTTSTSSDDFLVFTGTTAATLTLPTASGCTGREYWVKNASSNISLLTIATTSSQTIDGLSSWTLDEANETVRLVSNGSNWYVAVQLTPTVSGSPWYLNGNSVGSIKNIGTTSNYDLPFITNNTEKMRLTTGGNLGIGTTSFNATYPERFLADAGASGNTNFQNVIVGKGNTNSYAQLNIQNSNAGTGASSDVVATADNGNETTNYVDMGINSSANTAGVMGGANDAYLYNIGQNFLIGNGTASKSLIFLTGGTTQSSNERMRITGTGSVGIGTTSPAATLDVSGTYKLGTSGTALTNMIKTSFSINDATAFNYTTTETVSVTITGLTANASVIINPRAALPTGIAIAWVRASATNTLIIGFTNSDGTNRSIGSVTFDATIIQ